MSLYRKKQNLALGLAMVYFFAGNRYFIHSSNQLNNFALNLFIAPYGAAILINLLVFAKLKIDKSAYSRSWKQCHTLMCQVVITL